MKICIVALRRHPLWVDDTKQLQIFSFLQFKLRNEILQATKNQIARR